MNIAVRAANLADSDLIAELVTSLGYPTSSGQMRKRLENIAADEQYATLVACEGQRVIGFIGTRVGPLYERDGEYGQIMVLIVDADHRRQGIGRMLMDAAESMLAARGVRVLIVTSGNQRADAHTFYEKNGYTFTGRRYTKLVGSPAASSRRGPGVAGLEDSATEPARR